MPSEPSADVSAVDGERRISAAYELVRSKLGAERCIVLDGGIGTELPRVSDEPLWGTRALINAPDEVFAVHRRYLEAGCDVITTNTWGLAAAITGHEPRLFEEADAPLHWMDIARSALRLARQALAEEGREGQCAIAFSLNSELDSPEGREAIPLLGRLFEEEPADVLLVETLSLVQPSLYETLDRLLELGLPVWLSFRRCRHGPCGIYGQHWGGPEGDGFGRAARRFEEMGAGALLVNCIPPDHVDGMVSYLRDFTDLPLGVYPNLGYFTDQGWRSEPGVGGSEYARLALSWRAEGAQIVGGCCGVRPEHIAAAGAALADTKPGRRRPEHAHRNGGGIPSARVWAPWEDRRRRRLYPLPFPELAIEPGVQPPDEASFMVWRYLFREGIGARQRCLDIGCGSGIMGIQLALNGAAHVHAMDIDRRAVANTLTNAFRNGVDDRLSAAPVDIYPWTPEERYEVIVASLQQQPVDPLRAAASHRVLDYWGRSLIDQVIAKLPEALAPEGVAYLLQLSILSQQRTSELLDQAGFTADVVEFSLFSFAGQDDVSSAHVAHVEELSDAHHIRIGDRDVMVAYLLEVRAKDQTG